ncbi:hypothetical protein [Dongia sp.]|uniref:hypothetical protein n=1 Tax=Dongia sp. TaxID=1977262 RepID=UPI0035AFF1A7
MTKHDYSRAAREFLPIVLAEKQPASAHALACIERIESEAGASALSACQIYAQEMPRDRQAIMLLGLAKLREGDIDGAREETRSLLDLKNLYPPALMFALADPDLEAKGTFPPTSNNESVAITAVLPPFRSGDFAHAAEILQKAYDESPLDGDVALLLFVAQKRANINETIDLADGDATYNMLVDALTGKRTPTDSLRTFREKWWEQDWQYPRNRFYLGEAALFQGDKEGAIRFFRKAVAAKKLGQVESELAAAELVHLEAE